MAKTSLINIRVLIIFWSHVIVQLNGCGQETVNEIHRIINEIHRSKPKPTSVASENVLAI